MRINYFLYRTSHHMIVCDHSCCGDGLMLAKLKFPTIIIIIIGYIPSKIFYGSLMYVSYFCPEMYK